MTTTHHAGAGERIRRLLEIDRTLLPPDGGPRFNRLIFSTNTYLLQHAENPVDWYPWGDEAFARARAEDKPVLVSIGYATCHWCHMMERESFEDPEVAAAINRNCIAVKVDREERPDIDEQYMATARMMIGNPGWPLNVIMTPDRIPFFVATYLPKESRDDYTGIAEIMEKIGEVWRSDREKVAATCAEVAARLADLGAPQPAGLPGHELLADAYNTVAAAYDQEWGGFGQPPKFPRPLHLLFLLRVQSRFRHPVALTLVESTLRTMRAGGVYDQLGFGFHRYSTDRHWLVPHFEKMLYDQALVALAAIETFQATQDDRYRRIAAEIFTYLLRDLTVPDGGFSSAEDADTEGGEGTYYLWTPAELRELLGDEDGARFGELFDVTTGGNFEGKSILHRTSPEDLPDRFEGWRQTLLTARARRVRPLRDEKVLTAWNGLAVAALARGHAVTGEEAWRNAAERAARFVLSRLVTPEGRLLRSWHAGEAAVPGFLEDYAFFTWGLIELFQATLQREWLDRALGLTDEMQRLFGDGSGGLYDTGADAEALPVRMRSIRDGVIPAGASVAALNILRLGRIVNDGAFTRAGEALLQSCMGTVQLQPAEHLFMLVALDFILGARLEAGIVGGTDEERQAAVQTLHHHFIPGLVVNAPPGDGPFAVHICTTGSCRMPVHSVAELEGQLGALLG